MTSATGRRAFTFIELIIVITLIAVLSSLAVPQLRKTIENFRLESFIKDLFYLCQYLQTAAASEAKIHCLNIAKEDNEFWATFKEDNQFKDLEGRFGKKYKAPEQTVISIDPPDKTNIYFYPDGSTEKITITLKNKYEREISLIIQGSIGEIKIQ